MIDYFCYCPEGSYLNMDNVSSNSYDCIADSTKVNCISGVIKSGITYCSRCGYGTKLNPATNTCVCNGNSVTGGCTTIPQCNYVSYMNAL